MGFVHCYSADSQETCTSKHDNAIIFPSIRDASSLNDRGAIFGWSQHEFTNLDFPEHSSEFGGYQKTTFCITKNVASRVNSSRLLVLVRLLHSFFLLGGGLLGEWSGWRASLATKKSGKDSNGDESHDTRRQNINFNKWHDSGSPHVIMMGIFNPNVDHFSVQGSLQLLWHSPSEEIPGHEPWTIHMTQKVFLGEKKTQPHMPQSVSRSLLSAIQTVKLI